MGLYARSLSNPPPDPLGDQIRVHTRAEPEAVPSEVTTGALEPKPKASEDWPTRSSVGVPEPFVTPYW